MLDLTIYSYGYAKVIYNTLQAIAMIRNSEFYTTVICTIALISGCIYAIYMVGARSDAEWKSSLKKIIYMIIFINALLLPTASMSIKDNVEKHFWKVDNIPLAFALPVGLIESFGHIITIGFEQAFSVIDGASSHNYYHYGTVFGARLHKEVLLAKVRDPEFTSNMFNFIDRCIMVSSNVGNLFTKEELVASSDLWGLITKKVGTFSRVQMTINGERKSPHITCKEAIPYFENKFKEAMSYSFTSWAWKFKGAGNDKAHNLAYHALNDNIKKQISAIYNNTDKVDSILKHNMMINSLNTYLSGNYPATKALLHAEAGGLISGDLADKTLTGTLAIMKVIIYGSFILLFPLLILSGGIRHYRSWITAAFSLALWPALFSMLNMIIDYAFDPASIVSYSGWSTEFKKFDRIASYAAGLTIILPFVAFWITRMAEGGFVHLAGSIMASTNNASAAIAGEKASGSRSWDNESIRNISSDNVSSNKYDSSIQYVSGSARSTMADGSMQTITPEGKIIYTGGAGISSSVGETSYKLDQTRQAQITEGIQSQEALHEQLSNSYASARSSTFSNTSDFISQIARREHSGETINYESLGEEGKTLQQAVSNTISLHDRHGYDWGQAAKASISSGTGFSVGIPFTKTRIGVNLDGNLEASNTSSQSVGKDISINQDMHTSSSYNNLVRAASNNSWAKENNIDATYSDAVRSSYDDQQRLEQQLSVNKQKLDDWHRAEALYESQGSTASTEMFQEVADKVQEMYGVDNYTAYRMASRKSNEAVAAWNNIQKQDKYVEDLVSHISHGKAAITGRHREQRLEDFNDAYSNKIQNASHDIQGYTKNQLDISEVEGVIKNTATDITSKHTNMTEKNSNQYSLSKIATESQIDAKELEVEKYEQDRIGKGSITTVGGITKGLGKPDLSQKDIDSSSFDNKLSTLRDAKTEEHSTQKANPRSNKPYQEE